MSAIVQCKSCGAKNRIKELDTGHPVCGKCKTALDEPGFGHPADLDNQSFEFLVGKSKKPVLVDFWASWCGPCKMMAPVLGQFAQSQSKVRVAKVNTEQYQQLAAQYGIQSIPTMILFENGKEIKRISGAMPLPALQQQLSQWL